MQIPLFSLNVLFSFGIYPRIITQQGEEAIRILCCVKHCSGDCRTIKEAEESACIPVMHLGLLRPGSSSFRRQPEARSRNLPYLLPRKQSSSLLKMEQKKMLHDFFYPFVAYNLCILRFFIILTLNVPFQII